MKNTLKTKTPETQILVDNGPNNNNIFSVILKKSLKRQIFKKNYII